MNAEAQTPIHQQRRFPKRLLGLVGLGVVLICGGLYYWLELPRYIELTVEPPGKNEWHWNPTERIVQTWDKQNVFYIWRRETQVYTGSCSDSGLDGWQSIIEYFDKWFIQQKWERAEQQGDTHCYLYLPESNFLPMGKENGYVAYKPAGSQPYQPGPAACLAVWPTEGSDSFYVVLTTGIPSPLTAFLEGFD